MGCRTCSPCWGGGLLQGNLPPSWGSEHLQLATTNALGLVGKTCCNVGHLWCWNCATPPTLDTSPDTSYGYKTT